MEDSEVAEGVGDRGEDINILYTNMDCYINKRKEFCLFLGTLCSRPHVIALTEVNSKKQDAEKVEESELQIDGYNLYCSNLSVEKRRGVLLYVDVALSTTQLDIASEFNEYIAVKIRGRASELIVCNVYRSPNSSSENDISLSECITRVNSYNCRKILVGDFNFPVINWQDWTVSSTSTSAGNFLSCLRKNFLFQHVDQPTRARGSQTPHALDLVITDEDFISDIEYLSPVGKSDHSVLNFCVNWGWSATPGGGSKLNYAKGDYEKIRSYMDRKWDQEFSDIAKDVNACWNRFKEILNEGINKYIPRVNSNDWKKNQSWKHPISTEMRKNIRRKHRLWTRFIETRDVKAETEYKRVRNLVREESRIKERQEQHLVAVECKENPKKFWNYVRNKTKTRSGIGDIEVNKDGIKTVLQEDSAKVEAFNEYFSSVFTVEPTGDFLEMDKITVRDNMQTLKITEEAIINKLLKLKIDKSPGPDCLHPRVLREISAEIGQPLKHIFGISLEQGTIPEDWRSSNVTAIYKKGRKVSMENYRPVSLTCIVCKVLESLVRDHLMEYFLNNKLFSNKQFGFIKGRSTVLQLLNILDRWTKYLEEGGQIDVIYTDFEKAFDKVPHKRLISKLKSYGISPEIVRWIEGFLLHRQQRVGIRGHYSDWRKVLSGIPQGSVLGPLLFVIFINDLPGCCGEGSEIYLFADDAKIMKHIKRVEDCEDIQRSCDLLQQWSDRWLLKLNTSKCMALKLSVGEISYNNKYSLVKSGKMEEMKEVSRMKDLGVTIDNKLTFKDHIAEKVHKAYSMIGIIKRNFKYMDKDSFLMIYKSMVRSHLEYANSVWNPYRIGLMYDLEKVQKRATKTLPACRNKSYEERLRYLDLPTLAFRRNRGDMIEVYKILSQKYDPEVTVHLERDVGRRTRGNSKKLKAIRSRYDIRKYTFSVRTVNLWNSLSEEVVAAESVNSFKNRLDKFWEKQEIKYNWKAKLTGAGIRSLDM